MILGCLFLLFVLLLIVLLIFWFVFFLVNSCGDLFLLGLLNFLFFLFNVSSFDHLHLGVLILIIVFHHSVIHFSRLVFRALSLLNHLLAALSTLLFAVWIKTGCLVPIVVLVLILSTTLINLLSLFVVRLGVLVSILLALLFLGVLDLSSLSCHASFQLRLFLNVAVLDLLLYSLLLFNHVGVHLQYVHVDGVVALVGTVLVL